LVVDGVDLALDSGCFVRSFRCRQLLWYFLYRQVKRKVADIPEASAVNHSY
jgi:hypothetical protein